MDVNRSSAEKLKAILSENESDMIAIWYSILHDFSVFYFKI